MPTLLHSNSYLIEKDRIVVAIIDTNECDCVVPSCSDREWTRLNRLVDVIIWPERWPDVYPIDSKLKCKKRLIRVPLGSQELKIVNACRCEIERLGQRHWTLNETDLATDRSVRVLRGERTSIGRDSGAP